MTYQFPKDERFRKLAAKLADAVQVAIWSGKKVTVTPEEGTFCPMGCLPDLPSTRPSATMAMVALGCCLSEAYTFICGFDGLGNDCPRDYQPWFQLGMAYRERFR